MKPPIRPREQALRSAGPRNTRLVHSACESMAPMISRHTASRRRGAFAVAPGFGQRS